MAATAPHRHPAWFGAVMGTGALAVALAAQATAWSLPWLTTAAFAVLMLASALAIVLLPRYLARVSTRASLQHELADPAHGPMLATLPAGLLILSIGWGRIAPAVLPAGTSLGVAVVLLVVGTFLALALGLTWSAAMLQGTNGLEGVNGGWLIPPVMNLLVPLALAPVIVANPTQAPLLVLIGLAFLGIGAILFLAVLTLLIARLATGDPLPAAMAPSMWIPLAPAGVLGLSTLRLQEAAVDAGVEGFTSVTTGIIVSAMGLGFGLWWAGFALVELRRIRRAGGAPVHPGWWGFVFPVAAMTLSITAVGSATDIGLAKVLGLLATVLLLGLWLLVALRTAPMLRRGPA